MVVIGLGKNLLFKSFLAHCAQGEISQIKYPGVKNSGVKHPGVKNLGVKHPGIKYQKLRKKSTVHNIPLSRQKKLDKLGYLSKRLLKVIVLKSLMTVCLSTENCCHFDLEFLDPLSARLFHLFDFEFMLTAYCFKVN